MPRYIVVSDLHCDTWGPEEYGEGIPQRTKLDFWREFLDWCHQKQITGLVINGDLMDAPPYVGKACFTSDIARAAVERLLEYAQTHRVTYIYGNHDIGVSGLRCMPPATLGALANVNLCYPDYVLPVADTILLLQHGHLYDPALLLYLRDLSTRTYIATDLEAFQWVQQRWDPATRTRPLAPGVSTPAVLDLSRAVNNHVYHAIKLADFDSPPTAREVRAAQRFLKRRRRGRILNVVNRVKHYLWWEAAKEVMGDYLETTTPPLASLYCLMGHTHVPDGAEVTLDGVKCRYLNSGTWSCAGSRYEDGQYATYVDVREDGRAWLQDWIWDRKESL